MLRRLIQSLTVIGCLLAASLSASAEKLSTLELLKKLISIDTTNPPGNEATLAKWIQSYLAENQISSDLIESAPGRANLVARLKGQGKVEPILLLGHLDVVHADPAEWKFPPFQATEEGGYLYGRGAIDMKGMVAMEISVFMQLKAHESELAGDVILALVADEESGGAHGAKFLVEKHWDKVACRMVFNEGSIGLQKNGLHLWPVQVAEKGVAWMKVSATGNSGHGSMPSSDNAVVALLNALQKISKPQPITETPIVKTMLKKIGEKLSFPKSFALKHFFSWPIRKSAGWFFSGRIESEKIFNAMLRNTVTPTVLKAGNKTNVIPSKAEAEIDVRILPGETPEGFREKLLETIDDPRISLELIHPSAPTESPFQTEIFRQLEAAILKQDAEALVVPYLSPGATDNRFFRQKGILAYGIIPMLVGPEEMAGLHGKNERVPIAELDRGERILLDFVLSLQRGP